MIFRVFGELKVAESSKGSSRNGSERRDGKMAIGGRGQGSLGMTEELAWRKSPVGERERERPCSISVANSTILPSGY